MLFNNPISEEKADRLIRLLRLAASDRVLDVGCGQGEFLIRIAETSGAQCVGVDRDAELIEQAKETAAQRGFADRCDFRAADMDKIRIDRHSFDAAVCIGSTHAFGLGDQAYPNALRQLTGLVRPGGQLLIGEGYWKQPPSPDYLKFLGDTPGIYHDHRENIAFAVERGLVPLYATTSNDDEWDHFEWSHRMKVEREAASRPDDADVQKKLKRSRSWRDGYLRWGRSTMGFGFYLFRTPMEGDIT